MSRITMAELHPAPDGIVKERDNLGQLYIQKESGFHSKFMRI
jgi:hypothetical protein